MSHYTIISAADAEERFAISDRINYPYLDFAEDQEIRLYEGDVTISGNFETDPDVDWNPFNVIVVGNLTVEGTINWHDYSGGNFLFVTGNTHAQNVIASGCPNLYVGGNLTVDNVVMTSYGDDGGTLHVEGDLSAEILLNCYYFQTSVKGQVNALVLSDEYDVNFPIDFESDSFEDIFKPEALDEDGEFDPRTLRSFVVENRRFLRDNIVPPHVATLQHLEELAKNPLAIESLDLSGKFLREFPEIITEFINLKELNLAHNEQIIQIPASFAALTQLEKLDLSQTSLTELPEEFGTLTSLQVLDLSYCSSLQKLPDSFGNLSALQVLDLSGVPAALSLPQSFANLGALETLVLSQCTTDFDPMPPALFDLPNLRALDLSSNQWKEIPDDLLKLSSLEELNLTRTLSGLSHMADLSKLPRLRRLKFTGLSSTGQDTTNYPQHDIIATALACTHLEELSLDRWGKADTYNDELDDYVVVRKKLKKLPEGAFANMPNLKWLDLSFNELKTLPESFFQLKNLEFVNLQYTELNRETLDRIARDCSTIRMDLRNVPTKQDSNDPHWKAVNKTVKKASKALEKSKYAAACKSFEQAIEMMSPGRRFSDYDQLFAHYGMLHALGYIVQEADESDALEAAERARLMAKCMLHARKCLELTPDPNLVWHFTDEGEFHKEVIRTASNALAWYLYENQTGAHDLEEALSLIEKAISCITEPHQAFLYDTKVRILLALNRQDDAYPIVNRILANDPDFYEFQDLKTDENYQTWAAANR